MDVPEAVAALTRSIPEAGAPGLSLQLRLQASDNAAGVSGNLNPGKSLRMLPTGLVANDPFQKPLRSGWPSAVRGIAADLVAGAFGAGALAAGV